MKPLKILTCPPNIGTGDMLEFSWTKGEGYGWGGGWLG